MNASLPVLLLSGAGIVITILGLFAAGEILIVAVGLSSVFAGGVLHIAELAIRSRARR
jgi:Flp pilus assembly protein protease CpaA